MIRPLRSRHRWMIVAITLIVPPLFVFGVMSRATVPAESALNPEITGPRFEDANIVWRGNVDGEELQLRASVYEPVPSSFAVGVELFPSNARPDMLIYWQSRSQPLTERPDESAYLIGALGGRSPATFILPMAAATEEGRLILYSLGHQQRVAVLELPAGREAGR